LCTEKNAGDDPHDRVLVEADRQAADETPPSAGLNYAAVKTLRDRLLRAEVMEVAP